MAILRPSEAELDGLEPEQPLMVDSDADSNAHAILEIERWCREHGLTRVQEGWLRKLSLENGTEVYRGVCYRPGGEWDRSRTAAFAEAERTARAMPATRSSVDILRNR